MSKYDFSGLWNTFTDSDNVEFRILEIPLLKFRAFFEPKLFSVPNRKSKNEVVFITLIQDNRKRNIQVLSIDDATDFCESEAEKRLDEVVEFAKGIEKK